MRRTGRALRRDRSVGRLAVVTGASSGIGRAFAVALARSGFDLLVVARRRDRLEALASELRARYGADVEVLVADLADPSALAGLVDEIAARPDGIDLLVAAAGVGSYGTFAALDPAAELAEVRVDVSAVVALARAVLPRMIERRRGDIVLVGSIVAHWPLPYMAVYAASKAFVRSFGEALAAEVRRHGVRVVTVSPGPVATEFAAVVGSDAAVRRVRAVAPERVVAVAFRALARGRRTVVVGAPNRAAAFTARLVPRRLLVRIAGARTRPPGAP